MIACVLVTYKPSLSLLRKCIDSVITQVDNIIIVNNDTAPLKEIKSQKIIKIEMKKNMGIAYAQNRGIEYAIENNYEYIMFSDQDTIYPKDFITKNYLCFDRHKNEKIAAVVPLFYNENKKEYSRINITKTHAINPVIGKEYFVSHAISSGTIVKANIFNDIGGMNERLFIDWVDYEWCWRAIKKEYNIICDTNIIINHNMGDSFKKIFGKKIVVYSDFRNYYFFRNGTWLIFHSHLFSFSELIKFAEFITIKLLLFFIINGISLKHIKLITKAFRRGISNQLDLDN